MILTVRERIILLSVLPAQGDFTTLKIVRKLREDLSFNEEEHKALQFKTVEGGMQWIQQAEKDADINVGEKATDVVKETLKKLNDEKKLTMDHMGLYEKFMDTK